MLRGEPVAGMVGARDRRFAGLRPALLVALALALPFLTPLLPITGDLEHGIQDAYRYALAPRSDYDPDIALVLYNDQVARSVQRTSPVDRALLARTLTQIAAAAPRAIAIDMAFVQAMSIRTRWSRRCAGSLCRSPSSMLIPRATARSIGTTLSTSSRARNRTASGRRLPEAPLARSRLRSASITRVSPATGRRRSPAPRRC